MPLPSKVEHQAQRVVVVVVVKVVGAVAGVVAAEEVVAVIKAKAIRRHSFEALSVADDQCAVGL